MTNHFHLIIINTNEYAILLLHSANGSYRCLASNLKSGKSENQRQKRDQTALVFLVCFWRIFFERCVIVSHGGEEFTSLPSPYTRDRYLKFLELGADVVVAHHPHVPENYELFDNGKAIFYSLGNFIFDTDYQRVHLYTDVGVLLKLIFTEEAIDFEAIGIRIIRGDERIDIAPLPAIFTDIPAAEYELLAPLSAKAFVAEDRRKMIYLEPERFTDASEDVWNGYFFSTEPDGYFEGAHMDFHIIVPFSEKAEEGAWKKSTLEPVKEYILRQL